MRQFGCLEGAAISLFERRRRVRRVRMIIDLTSNIIRCDESMTYREATSLVSCARKAILDLLPQYESQFERVVRPRLEHLITSRWPSGGESAPAFSPAHELVN